MTLLFHPTSSSVSSSSVTRLLDADFRSRCIRRHRLHIYLQGNVRGAVRRMTCPAPLHLYNTGQRESWVGGIVLFHMASANGASYFKASLSCFCGVCLPEWHYNGNYLSSAHSTFLAYVLPWFYFKSYCSHIYHVISASLRNYLSLC